MADALSQIRTRNTVTPQSEQADARQVPNSAGGWSFSVSDTERIKRFLMIGTDGGTYYISERTLTRENADVVIEFARVNGTALVRLLHSVSVSGRAPRQNPALFALAAVFAFGNEAAKKEAEGVFNSVVRTGTHLFTFVGYAEQLRGWGRALKRAVAGWYLDKDVNDLAYQLVKYRQRAGFTHRDVLRLAHPAPADTEKRALLDWACGRDGGVFYADGRPVFSSWIVPFEAAKGFAKLEGKVSRTAYADIVREHPGLPWEALPDVALTLPETWEALLDAGMPLGALLRNLSKLTGLGVLHGTSARLDAVTAQLTSQESLRRARVHPVKVLYALKTYASGHSARGSGSWTPVQKIVDALDAGFYASFATFEPAGKRTLLGLDVSGSMSSYIDYKNPALTCAEGSTAMAMVTAASEPHTEIMGFANTFRELPISPRRRLDDNVRSVRGLSFGGTDCALPMRWAQQNKKEFDTFVVYTDNETWAGGIHPHEALRQYRQATGINARLAVVGMASNGFTIADPSDAGMLDFVGFDADTPSAISGFSRGDF